MNPRLKSGEISPLFINLKEYLNNHSDALYWYSKATSVEFSTAFPNIKLDNDNEPSFKDLLNYCGLDNIRDEGNILKDLNSKFSKTSSISYSGMRDLQLEASDFNNTSIFKDNYWAGIEETADSKLQLIIKHKRDMPINEDVKISMNSKLNKQLEKWLEDKGIGIGALSKLEERLGINGITDLEVALKSAKGLKQVIRIAQGVKGQDVLPEEFAHFAISAIGEVPLKTRLLNTLKNEDILEKILEDSYNSYKEFYGNDLDLLAEEALGKLVAKALNSQDINLENKSLFDRFFALLKNFFGKFSTDSIDNIIKKVEEQSLELTSNILNNKYTLNISNINYKNKFANLEQKVSRDSALLKKIKEQELKRLRIYKSKEKFKITQMALINKIQKNIDNNTAIEGIYDYVSNSLTVFNNLNKKLQSLSDGTLSTQEKFDTLRRVRNYVSSYGSILKDIEKEMHKASREGDSRFKDKLKDVLSDNMDILGSLSADFYEISKQEFSDFIRPFLGEGLTLTLGRNKGKTYTAEELIESLDSDITVFDRWLDSMADSSDPMLQIYDQLVKKQKGLARLDTIEFQKEIMKKTRELELSGTKNTDFMFAKDDKGKNTGYFIQPTDWFKYNNTRHTFFKYLQDKYGEEAAPKDVKTRNEEIKRWYSNNTTKDIKGMTIPNSSYDSIEYKKLTTAEKDYHAFIMQSKAHFDAFLPNANINKAPQIRKDFLERVVGKGNKIEYFWESLKDNFAYIDDIRYKDTQQTIQDFEGKEVMFLPIYYTKTLEDVNDLSTDIASTMVAYASMANDFNRMNEVIDALEVGKLILEDRKVTQKTGSKSKVEKFNMLGHEVHNLLTKSGDATYFMQKLNTFLEMQVYGKTIKDEGSTLGVDRAKAANFLNKMTSYSTTAVSLLTGTANLVQNLAMSNMESVTNRYFGKKNLLSADMEYGKELPAYLGEIGNRIKTSKLALFGELFNISQNYKQDVRNIDFNKKTWASKLISENTLFFTTQAGDHWTQHRIAIAMAKNYYLLDNGKKTNLWDALHTSFLDSNKKLGATLVLGDGVTKEDGSKFTKEDIIVFSNKIRAVENNLYGIYNSEDKNAAQQMAIGRLVLLYRNWMRPLWLARFGRGKYNFDLGDCTEGYFQTMFNFIQQQYVDIKQSQFDIIKSWHTLDSAEKSNIKKGLTEVAFYWGLYALINLLHGLEDEKEKPWALRLASYTALRLKTDMGALLPSPTMLDEGLKLFTSPMASMATLKRIRNLVNLVDPSSYIDEIDSGMYKDYKEYQKILIDLLPFRRQVINAFDPDEPAKWYK